MANSNNGGTHREAPHAEDEAPAEVMVGTVVVAVATMAAGLGLV